MKERFKVKLGKKCQSSERWLIQSKACAPRSTFGRTKQSNKWALKIASVLMSTLKATVCLISMCIKLLSMYLFLFRLKHLHLFIICIQHLLIVSSKWRHLWWNILTNSLKRINWDCCVISSNALYFVFFGHILILFESFFLFQLTSWPFVMNKVKSGDDFAPVGDKFKKHKLAS